MSHDMMVSLCGWGRKKRHLNSYKFSRGQSKRRRRLIIAVRKRGYTTKAELKPHLKAINLAVRNNSAYTLPTYNPVKQKRRVPKPKPKPEPVRTPSRCDPNRGWWRSERYSDWW